MMSEISNGFFSIIHILFVLSLSKLNLLVMIVMHYLSSLNCMTSRNEISISIICKDNSMITGLHCEVSEEWE